MTQRHEQAEYPDKIRDLKSAPLSGHVLCIDASGVI